MKQIYILKYFFRYFLRKLEYAAQHDATKIGVINIKDLDGVKNAINVITAEDSKIFQCISVSAKVINPQELNHLGHFNLSMKYFQFTE